MTKIQVRRVYSDPDGSSDADGFRIYVDRLWPQGESHQTFHYDLWAKDVSPSTVLRQWFHADPATRWDEFAARYEKELAANPATDGLVSEIRRHPLVTLLFSSKNESHNNAVVLARYLTPLV